MVIVAGQTEMDLAAFERLREAAARMVAETRREEGCLSYSFAQDIAEPSIIRIFELWKDRQALDAHFQTAHMAAFNAALAHIDLKSIDVRIYDVMPTTE